MNVKGQRYVLGYRGRWDDEEKIMEFPDLRSLATWFGRFDDQARVVGVKHVLVYEDHTILDLEDVRRRVQELQGEQG